MIMVANLFVVISATIIDAMSGAAGKDYASGIRVSYLIGVGLALAGLVAVLLILPSSSQSKAKSQGIGHLSCLLAQRPSRGVMLNP